MKAKDYRISNLINCRFHNNDAVNPDFFWKPVVIDSISNDHIITLGQRIELKDKFLKPIELTKEWLIKFGFEKERGEFKRRKFNYVINNNTLYTNGEYNYIEICKIKYVHQLQNLYFALTETELEIK